MTVRSIEIKVGAGSELTLNALFSAMLTPLTITRISRRIPLKGRTA